jgi:transposase
MGQYVGLDVSLETTKVHVLDEQGKRVGTCVTHPTAIEATIRQHAPEAVRIGLETGPLTTWLWQALTEVGLPMACLDARQAALNMRINKTTTPRAWLTWCAPAGIARSGSRAARPCLPGHCSGRARSSWVS